MAQVSVTVGGRAYRIACGEGEEDHLVGLAAALDEKIGAMRAAFGEIGDGRMTIMAALTLADELSDTRKRLAAAEADLARATAEHAVLVRRHEGWHRTLAAALDDAAGAVEDATARLGGERSGAAGAGQTSRAALP